MKKQLAVIALSLILLPFGMDAQRSFRKEFAIGASFGMGASTVSFTPKVYTKMLPGVHFGVTGRWLTEKNLGLIVEVNYAQQGWAEEFAEPEKGYKYKRTLNFLDVPFLTHIYFGNERFRFFFNLGPKIGYMIGESLSENVLDITPAPAPPVKGNNAGITVQREKEIDKKFAWGLCGGPGVEFRTKIGTFQLEGRYYYGLGDLFSSRVGDDFSKSASQCFMGKITYLIPLTKKK